MNLPFRRAVAGMLPLVILAACADRCIPGGAAAGTLTADREQRGQAEKHHGMFFHGNVRGAHSFESAEFTLTALNKQKSSSSR